MTQKQLILRMGELSGLTQAQAEKALRAFRLALVEEILHGGVIQVLNFGTFRTVPMRRQKSLRNVRTGELVPAPSRRISFHASRSLRTMIHRGE